MKTKIVNFEIVTVFTNYFKNILKDRKFKLIINGKYKPKKRRYFGRRRQK